MSDLELENLVRTVVTRVLREQSVSSARRLAAPSPPPRAKLLVAVCCRECLGEAARTALRELERAGFELREREAGDLEKCALRDEWVAGHDGVLLPALGDDDLGKMAVGIFDTPVLRTALAALAGGKPVFGVEYSRYAAGIKTRLPQLHRWWENHRRAVEGLGLRFAEYSSLGETIGTAFAFPATPVVRPVESVRSTGRVLITAQDVEDAARLGASLRLGANALVTPLARDRAKELNVKMN